MSEEDKENGYWLGTLQFPPPIMVMVTVYHELYYMLGSCTKPHALYQSSGDHYYYFTSQKKKLRLRKVEPFA